MTGSKSQWIGSYLIVRKMGSSPFTVEKLKFGFLALVVQATWVASWKPGVTDRWILALSASLIPVLSIAVTLTM